MARALKVELYGQCVGTLEGQAVLKDAVDASLGAWNDPNVKSNFSENQTERIDRHIASVPLLGNA